jgi:hypothetical protein
MGRKKRRLNKLSSSMEKKPKIEKNWIKQVDVLDVSDPFQNAK